MSCGTGLRQVDRLGSRFDQLKLDTTLEFLQLIMLLITHVGRLAKAQWVLGLSDALGTPTVLRTRARTPALLNTQTPQTTR